MSNIPLSFLTATQQEKDSALVGAASFGNIAVATMLLDAGASVQATRDLGWQGAHVQTALNVAASRGDVHILRGKAAVLDLLLERGADVLTQEEKDRALFVAVSGSTGAVEVLLRHGANPNAKREDGQTPLHAAVVAHGDPLFLTMLLDAGADLDERDNGNNAPLRLAVEIGRTEAVRLLLDRGADPEVTHTPDHHIAELATPGSDVWTMLVLDPRTGPFRQRFELVVAQVDSATLKELLTQRTETDDLRGGIPSVLDRAYRCTSGQWTGAVVKTKTPSKWWAEARRCVRALVKAGAPDRLIDHHFDAHRRFTISAWFEIVNREITSGRSEFERTASTLTTYFIREAQRGLRETIDTETNTDTEAERFERVRL